VGYGSSLSKDADIFSCRRQGIRVPVRDVDFRYAGEGSRHPFMTSTNVMPIDSESLSNSVFGVSVFLHAPTLNVGDEIVITADCHELIQRLPQVADWKCSGDIVCTLRVQPISAQIWD